MPKILIVEDNELNRDMLSRRLERRGYETLVAVDGAQGLEGKAYGIHPSQGTMGRIPREEQTPYLAASAGGLVPYLRTARSTIAYSS